MAENKPENKPAKDNGEAAPKKVQLMLDPPLANLCLKYIQRANLTPPEIPEYQQLVHILTAVIQGQIVENPPAKESHMELDDAESGASDNDNGPGDDNERDTAGQAKPSS